MAQNFTILVAIFLAVTSFVVMLSLLLGKSQNPAEARVEEAAKTRKTRRPKSTEMLELESAKGALPRVGRFIMPRSETQQTKLRSRLQQAGLYRRHSMAFFLGLKMMLMIIPMGVGVAMSVLGFVSLLQGILL